MTGIPVQKNIAQPQLLTPPFALKVQIFGHRRFWSGSEHPLSRLSRDCGDNNRKFDMKTKNQESETVVAANDNPGGSRTTTVKLQDIATLMAQAYVAELKNKEQKG